MNVTPNRRTLTVRTSDRTRQRFRDLARVARAVGIRGDELIALMHQAVRGTLFRRAIARGIDVRGMLLDDAPTAVPSAGVYDG